MPDYSDIIGFYSEVATDNRGRQLTEIWKWDYQQLENVHDYIQWLFPLNEPSRFNPEAPILTDQDIREFNDSSILKFSLLRSFDLMLDFYGFEREHQQIRKAAHFEQRAREWLTPGDHNLLRISRILKSLRLLGLGNYATLFFDELSKLQQLHPDATAQSLQHWRDAVQGG